MDKKMIKVIGIVAGVFVVFIILLFIFASCTKKKFNFVKLQDTMIAAAKSYYKANEKELPKEDGKTKKVTLQQLINDGYMQEPSKIYKDDTLICDGSVTVTNNDGFYLYSPSLTCGKDKKNRTMLLKDKILEDSLVEEGVGLYETKLLYINSEDDINNPVLKDAYVFKGEVKNNYIKFSTNNKGDGKLFRILRINDDGTIRLIETKSNESVEWDDRYNYEKESYYGINKFVQNDKIDSRIKEHLKDYYNDSTLWPDSIKQYIVTQGLCIGTRSEEDSVNTGAIECSTGILNQRLGLISTYEFLNASLDKNCINTESYECENYNWLTDLNGVWTLNASSDDTYKVWMVKGTLDKSTANNRRKWNVVINISDKVTYVSGTGTEEDPYIIK